jgi:hypothetical protein
MPLDLGRQRWSEFLDPAEYGPAVDVDTAVTQEAGDAFSREPNCR